MIEMMKAAIFVEPGKMTVEEVPKATLRYWMRRQKLEGLLLMVCCMT